MGGKKHNLYIDNRAIPLPREEYIAWIDVMGIQGAMQRGVKIPGSFVFRLHLAATHAKTKGVRLYPVMDGFYAASPEGKEMRAFIQKTLLLIAEHFSAVPPRYRFVIRGGLAFGSVSHGSEVKASMNWELSTPENKHIAKGIVLGEPVINAFAAEAQAPPFGIQIHETANDEPLSDFHLEGPWLRWFKGKWGKSHRLVFLGMLEEYFDWCSTHSQRIRYPIHKINTHRGLCRVFFE